MIVEKIYSNYKSTSEREGGEGHFGHWLSCPFGSSSAVLHPIIIVRVKLVFRGENLTLLLALIMCMYHWNFTHEINYKSLRIETKSQEKNVKNIVVSSYHT